MGSFAEDEASSLVHGKVPLWADRREGVRELVQYLHCYPLAVAQAAEYARVYKTAAPGEYLEELKRAGLKLAKGKRQTKKGEYPVTFPEVVQLSLDKILQSDDAHAEDADDASRRTKRAKTSAATNADDAHEDAQHETEKEANVRRHRGRFERAEGRAGVVIAGIDRLPVRLPPAVWFRLALCRPIRLG